MARNKDKQYDPANARRKKSFWANFFEPVPSEEEVDPASANRQYGEPPEPPLKHLFSEDDLDFSDEEDAENLAQLTWEDGERVVSDTTRRQYLGNERAEAAAYQKKIKKQTGEPVRLFDDEEQGSDESVLAAGNNRSQTTRTRIFRTGASTTARIHINETEETVRMEEAQKKARAREAARKYEEYVERQLRKKKNSEMAAKLFGNIVLILVMMLAVAVALYYGFLLSDIVVMGNEEFSTEYITDLSGLQLGTHMLFCDLDEAESNIEENPYLQVESVTYIFPSRVRIIVSERKEVAGIVGLDNNVIIDKNGYVLSMAGGADISDLIQVTGVTVTGFQLGQRLGQGNDFSTATLVNLIAVIEEYNLVDSIRAIDLTTPLAITMTASNGLKIHVGQATDLESKMDVLARLLPQFIAKNITTGTLYLSAKGGTVYSTTSYQDRTPVYATDDTLDTANLPVDSDGDGIDDNTGLPYVSATPTPEAQVTPDSGGDDDFSG